MFGFGPGFDAADPPAPGVPLYRPETGALLARMGAVPGPGRAAAIDTLIGALIAGATSVSNIWAKLDVLQLFAATSAADSLLNWKGQSFAATVGGGAPVFVADRGWFANGIADVLDLGCAPADLAQFAQNSACYGAWMRTPAGAARVNSILGTQTASACTLNPRATSNIVGARINGAVADTSRASGDFYGLTTANRPSATQIQSGRNGSRGGLQSSASAARSAVRFGFGKCNNAFAEGQIAAFFAGAALSDAEESDLHAALAAYMATVGVTALTPAVRTLPLATGIKLPDGSAAPTAGKGMPCTGLVRRGDGRWYVGNGLAGPQGLCFSRVSGDFATLEAEFSVASLGLGTPPGAGSVQGMCIDADDPHRMWVVLKLGNGGSTTYLFAFDMSGETVVQAPVALPVPSCNGVADDGVAGTLLIAQDIGAAAGGMIRIDKTSGANTGALAQQMPGDVDHLFRVAVSDSPQYRSGDLLVTSGANVPGGAGTLSVMRKDDYGGYCTRRIDTLSGADAIEGIVLHGGTIHIANDGATHPGTPSENRVLTYAA